MRVMRHPKQRLFRPNWANTVLFLVCDESANMTDQSVTVDGGGVA
jgi:NAD(P)-dependent dehydrogenase (short-subunit alcohol dehydrogenase family)